MGLFSACFPCIGNRAGRDARMPHRRHVLRPCRRVFSRLIHTGRRNQRLQDQLEQTALNEIHQASETLTEERVNQRNQEQFEEEVVNEMVLDSTIEPLTQEGKGEIETPNPQYFETRFNVMDSERNIAPHGTSRTSTIQPKMQFLIFCIFFLLCFYANIQQEAQIQDLVENIDNTTLFLDSTSEMDHFKWIIFVKYILGFMFICIFAACILFRESIFCTILLLCYVLSLIEARDDSRWLRWLRWIDTR